MSSILGIVKGWYKSFIDAEVEIYMMGFIVGMACLLALYAVIGGIYLGAKWLLS